MDTELFRSWCLELPEATLDYAGQKEIFKIEKKTFAIIDQDIISLKCNSQAFQKAIIHADIEPAKNLSRYNWITINKFDDLQVEDMHEFIIDSYYLIIDQFPKKIRKKLQKKLLHEIDSPWKDVLNVFFKEFMEFFLPDIADDIDWTKAPIFMDKELSKILKESKTGNRYVDKLVKVWKKSGDETWVLLHIEVQGQEQEVFPLRLFIYSNRLSETYKMPVASFAVLADDNPKWRPSEYREEIWGNHKTFTFPAIKLLDYKSKWNELEKSDNPFALVVMTHLKMLETKKNKSERLHWKIELTKMLYNKGYTKDQIYDLYKFIDWIMVLPDALTRNYHKTITDFKEEHKMRYITTAERIGRKDGRLEGEIKGKIEGEIQSLKKMRQMNYLPKNEYEKLVKPLQLKLKKIQD
jgi:predicted DNA-binding protein (MmcQ/YjbR family)